MKKTITAAPVERDSYGFWTHPDFFEPANGNEFGVEGEFDAWKALNRVVGKLEWMECEENAEDLQSVYNAGDCNLNMWQPTPPAGDGWFTASIHDTEDGPVCYWLRPIEFDPEALVAHFDNCYAEAFKTEHLVAERDSALNTCSLIAEALGITGAVAGDTIARVRQLVAEGAVMKQIIDSVTDLDNEPQYHSEGMGCGLEDRGITDRYDAMQHGWNCAVERVYGEVIPCAEELNFSATDAAINEIKAQGVEEAVSRLEGEYGELDDVCVMVFLDLREFAASLRGGE